MMLLRRVVGTLGISSLAATVASAAKRALAEIGGIADDRVEEAKKIPEVLIVHVIGRRGCDVSEKLEAELVGAGFGNGFMFTWVDSEDLDKALRDPPIRLRGYPETFVCNVTRTRCMRKLGYYDAGELEMYMEYVARIIEQMEKDTRGVNNAGENQPALSG